MYEGRRRKAGKKTTTNSLSLSLGCRTRDASECNRPPLSSSRPSSVRLSPTHTLDV